MATSSTIISNKWILHPALGVTIIVSFFIFIHFTPQSWVDFQTKFGTLSFFITAYGVLFAVIELIRLKSAAQNAYKAALDVYNGISNIYTTREITECQGIIASAIANLEQGTGIASSNLLGITRLYSRVFPTEVSDEKSVHRRNKSYIESYNYDATSTSKNSRKTNKTQSALLSIASHLAILEGSTKNSMEPKK